jgi:hypothetical protein
MSIFQSLPAKLASVKMLKLLNFYSLAMLCEADFKMGQASIAYHRFGTTKILHCCLSAIAAFAASKMALILLR